ncbi:ABC transporter substrate-binding protein [Gemmiger formicilis]|uniref:ABC transporter substrate-binding protein n=1 Tax=Gemmiger formicilis TaxID=745368 RepID=UPI001958EBCB|nr:ABC transporter substrate-binding protein [Gemmiger formicilis]MBM6914142.1 ABC transporter substrate-binding protein [Gemmiger formicilis]
MKKILCFVLAAAMALSLAACGNGSNGNASDGNTIKVGVIANTTGDSSQYGIAVSQGAKLYIKQLNEEGGINGKQIEVVEYDDKGATADAVNAYERMKSDGVTAVIGAVLTNTTLAVADKTYEDNMPQITASATAASVTVLDPTDENSDIRTNVFRACFIDPFQGEKMAEYAQKLGATKCAVLYDSGNDYAKGVGDAFAAKCEELGIECTIEGYATGDKDFKAQLTNIKASGAEYIMCPNYLEDVGLIVRQAREQGITAGFLGGDGWSGVTAYASAEDLEGSYFCSGYALGSNAEFEEAYAAEYKEAPKQMFEALGYDAALLMCNALKSAEEQGLEAGSDEYKQAVIDAMKATNGLEGVTGTFSFDDQNNPIKSASILQIQGGEEVFVENF